MVFSLDFKIPLVQRKVMYKKIHICMTQGAYKISSAQIDVHAKCAYTLAQLSLRTFLSEIDVYKKGALYSYLSRRTRRLY